MRSSPCGSRAVARVVLALGAFTPMALPRLHGQEHSPPAVSALDAGSTRRVEELDRAINQRLGAGQIAEAIAPAQEKLDRLARTRGQDHWQTADARRDVQTYRRLAGLPREAQDRYAKARQADNRAGPLSARGRYAEAAVSLRESLAICRDILGEDHPRTAAGYSNLGDTLRDQAKYTEAEAMLRRALAIQLKALGENHPDTATTYNNLAMTLRAVGNAAEAEAMHRKALAIRLEALGEDHPDTATSLVNLASTIHDQGNSAEAEAMFRRALAIRLKALGENDPDVAECYNDLAEALRAQGKAAEAEPLHRRTLAICRKVLSEDHPHTATSYKNLADTLYDQGKFTEAEAMHRRALAITLKALGEDHSDTAGVYKALALTLLVQGKSAEAEAMHRRALAINLKALGEEHLATVASFNDLALSLRAQDKYAEAEAMLRRAVAINLKIVGEDKPNTATTYDNLASILRDQGKYDEADAMFRRALAIIVKARGERHRDTAICYNNLARNESARGNYAEAEAMHRRALAIKLDVLGEAHPSTASSLTNLAMCIAEHGNPIEAEAMHRRALAIKLKLLGEGHPDTVVSYNLLAWCLDRQGKNDDALKNWAAATASFEQARLGGTRGLDAALTAARSPLPAYALALARAGRPRDAWARAEQGLARGLADELTGRAARPLTPADHDHEARLLEQAQALDERIGKLLTLKARSGDQDKLFDELNRQASELRRQVLELEQQFENRYGALAGQPVSLAAAQAALPEGTALVAWIDQGPYHSAWLLKHSGDPIWVRLPGSGQDNAWTKHEEGLAERLRSELNPETTHGNARPLAEALARQRLEPLKDHLKGVNRLVVVNSPGLAGVPIDLLMAPSAEGSAGAGVTVAYAPSASLFAYLVGKPTARDGVPNLLALADPAYPETSTDAPAPAPPDAGLVIARVVPNSNADLNGIQAGDVLMAYAGTALKVHADLKTVAAGQGAMKVPVRYWREGMIRDVEVAAGSLGVAIDRRPVKVALRDRLAAERVLLGMRGGSHHRLPGTRREVEAVARLFPAGAVTTVMGEQACEATVQSLARSGRMKSFRYLHFATHGESNPSHAYRSALILAPDPERSADSLAFDSDGTITAEQIARTWDLDADLVVLSACESGLGRAAGGEGYLGFAQPLFARGARSLVLSLWKVDDDATALLMTRFYQNLLGTRAGLKSPLPKAEALAEAKAWLRAAGPDEAVAALKALPRGAIVRRELAAPAPAARPDETARPAPVAPTIPPRPYEDPSYWAGFILIGSPD